MQIGHSGHTRFEEIMLATGLAVLAVRTAIPFGSGVGVYGHLITRIIFGALIGVVAVWLFFASRLRVRRLALFYSAMAYGFTGILVLLVDWTRFGTAAALLVLALVSAHLHYVAAREIKWILTLSSSQSSHSSEEGQSSS